MPILICAATEPELRAALPCGTELEQGAPFTSRGNACYAVTGVGVPLALASLLALVERSGAERVLNVGIAGAYPHSGLAVGDVVMADSEVYGDIGFEMPEGESFTPISHSPFGGFPYEPMALETISGCEFPRGRGCTVGTCTGTEQTGLRRERQFGARFETMEGAAVAQAGLAFGIPVSEVRAISNIAGTRHMKPENIRLALEALSRAMREIEPWT